MADGFDRRSSRGPRRPPRPDSSHPSSRSQRGDGNRPRGATSPVLSVRGELLYGRNGVIEALRGPRTAHLLYLAEGMRDDERLRQLTSLAEDHNVQIERVSRVQISEATGDANHQGVALDASPFEYGNLNDAATGDGTVLVLDHLQDPQNFGTLLRAADATGVSCVVIPADRAVRITPAVVNASAGAVEHLSVVSVPNLARSLTVLKDHGRWALGLERTEQSVDLFQADLPLPAALVVGSEGEGIGHNVRRHCDLLVSLPMRGQVGSLNAATAGAIALFELMRRGQT